MEMLTANCGCDYGIGAIFVVSQISNGGPCKCRNGHRWYSGVDAYDATDDHYTEISRLKLIDPPALRDDVPADERLKERA